MPSGGTVEPANRAGIVKEKSRMPPEAPGERYELRDPFADVTYRTGKLDEMVAKAQQLGSKRFTAIAEDGTRTVVQRFRSGWQRGEQLPPAPQRPLDLLPANDEVPDAAGDGKKPRGETAPVQKNRPDEKAVAKTDAEAERAELVVRLESALKERYIIKRAPVLVGDVSLGHTEYRFRGDSTRIAFTESTFRLATDTNSPSVARSMVDVAQARNWKGLRISGSEDFRRMVWLEASVRGVQAVGYEPNPGDMDVLKREREARRANRIELAQDAPRAATTTAAEKSSARGGGGRKAVVAAIEAVLVAKRVPEAQRNAVLTAAAEKLAQRSRGGQPVRVKVYDRTAEPQRSAKAPTPELGRSQERSEPARAR
jgi:hypothetical protein